MNPISVYTCLRCGHEWPSRRQERPRICPKCKTAYWDVPRTKPKQKKGNTPA